MCGSSLWALSWDSERYKYNRRWVSRLNLQELVNLQGNLYRTRRDCEVYDNGGWCFARRDNETRRGYQGATEAWWIPSLLQQRHQTGKYSRFSISRTRISRNLRNSKCLSESKIYLIASSNHLLAPGILLQVQIIRSANQFALRVIWTCKKESNQLRDIEIWLYIQPLLCNHS